MPSSSSARLAFQQQLRRGGRDGTEGGVAAGRVLTARKHEGGGGVAARLQPVNDEVCLQQRGILRRRHGEGQSLSLQRCFQPRYRGVWGFENTTLQLGDV